MPKELVTISDIRKAGHCAAGAKRWFAGHQLDFRKFLQDGIEADVLLATQDQLANDVVNHKRRRTNNG